MPVTRGTTNSNARGSTADRAARRAYLLETFGDGTTAPCSYCTLPLTDATITVDRPACGPCNSSRGGRLAGLVSKP